MEIEPKESLNIARAYDQWSEIYDTNVNRTRDLDRQVTRLELEAFRPQAILELGCGTGKNTAFFARIGQSVTAVDFSEGMIARAKAKIGETNVSFQTANITCEWPFEDQAFDFIACNLVLEHIADLSFIFSEARRVLQSGGTFFISELHPYRQYQGSQAQFTKNGSLTFVPAFVHHLSDFIQAGTQNGLKLSSLNEWWHEKDKNKPPRLISLLFKKS